MFQDLQDQRVTKVTKGKREPQETKDKKVHRVLKGTREPRATRVIKA